MKNLEIYIRLLYQFWSSSFTHFRYFFCNKTLQLFNDQFMAYLLQFLKLYTCNLLSFFWT